MHEVVVKANILPCIVVIICCFDIVIYLLLCYVKMSNNALIAEEDLTLKCIVLTPGKKDEKTLGNALYNGLIKFLSVSILM